MIFSLSQQRLGACGIAAALSLLAISASVHATQTVDPTLTVGGASIQGTTRVVPAGSTFIFYGMYTDNSAGAESGLGLKVKYNPAHLTNLTISEEYTKCRIAAAQVQPLTGSTAQAVMGWVDTSVRTAGAVGWPDLADTVAGGATAPCLNPGAINIDTAAGTAAAPGQKLFKVTATMAPSCTSAGACTSQVLFDSDGNFSYATTPSGFTNKSFTINGAAAPTCNLDVDGDGLVTAPRDGVLLQRALNPGITDANVINGVAQTGATRTTGAAIRAYLSTFVAGGVGVNAIGASVLDVDGSSTTTSPVDGNAIKRALNPGILSANITNGLNVVAGTTGAAIRTYLNANCGTSLTP